MAKRRKSKGSTKCPEPFNTLIDLAAAFTLDYIYAKRRKKNGRSKVKIDPYAATGAAMGMGLIHDTEDLIKFGGVLGAMGAFDDDAEIPAYHINDNRYAWRLNCEDGTPYGLYPEDYETRQDYQSALSFAKGNEMMINEEPDAGLSALNDDEPVCDELFYCRVARLDNGQNEFFLAGDPSLRVGSRVHFENGSGIVLSIHHCEEVELPEGKVTNMVIQKEV